VVRTHTTHILSHHNVKSDYSIRFWVERVSVSLSCLTLKKKIKESFFENSRERRRRRRRRSFPSRQLPHFSFLFFENGRSIYIERDRTHNNTRVWKANVRSPSPKIVHHRSMILRKRRRRRQNSRYELNV